MAATFANLLSCTLGGAEFQLSSYEHESTPIEDDEGEIAGREIVYRGEGWIEASDHSTLASRLTAAQSAFEVAGQNFTITGPGGAVYENLPAAICFGDGPLVTITKLGSEGLVRKFRFQVKARVRGESITDSQGQGQVVKDTRRVKVDLKVEGVEEWELTGTLRGPDAAIYFVATTVEEVRAAYAWPKFVVTYEYERNFAGDELSYTIRVRETTSDLPANGANKGLDGRTSRRTERDEHGRKLEISSHDYIYEGDPQQLMNALRPLNPMRESMEVVSVAERRVRCEFTVLRSADGTGLLDWTFGVEINQEDATVRAYEYPGASAVLVYNPTKPYRCMMTGRAVAVQRFVRAPSAPEINGYFREEYPQPRFSRLNDFEMETSWSYRLIGMRGIGPAELKSILLSLSRPKSPQFLT